MMILRVDHLAVICSDIRVSKKFYMEMLGCALVAEVYREERRSHKVDLQLPGLYAPMLELFTFPAAPARPTQPEARGLRHLALNVWDLDRTRTELINKGLACEEVRTNTDGLTRFFFTRDPDGLPIEFVGA